MKSAVSAYLAPRAGALVHRIDVLRSRSPEVGTLPDAPGFVAAAVTHWAQADRSEYLRATIRSLFAQAPTVSVALCTNDPESVARELMTLGREVEVAASSEQAARRLVDRPGVVLCVRWTPARWTHPFNLTWAHKAVFAALVRSRAFDRGVTHLLYCEDDMGFHPGALRYWTEARPVLAPLGLIPGYTRVEGPPDDLRLTNPSARLRLSELPYLVRRPLAVGGPPVLWANLRNPYQACYILDAPLASTHLRTSRFRGPLQSRSSKTIGGRWATRERAAAGPIFDDVPPGPVSTNVVPLTMRDGELSPVAESLVEHLPANYYSDPTTKIGTVALRGGFVDDRPPRPRARRRD